MHVPLPENYPHSEVQVFRSTDPFKEVERLKPNALQKSMSKFLRGELSKNATVGTLPKLSSHEWKALKEDRMKLLEEIVSVALSN